MMSLRQFYEHDKELAASLLEAADRQVKKGNPLGAIFPLQNAFTALKCQALVEWRNDFGDPRPSMRRAIAVAERAHEYFVPYLQPRVGAPKTDIGPGDYAAQFDFASASILCFFLNEGSHEKLQSFADVWDYLLPCSIRTIFRPLDTKLGQFFIVQRRDDEWDRFLGDFPRKPALKLSRDTIMLYSEITRAIELRQADKIAELASTGAELYERRKSEVNKGDRTLSSSITPLSAAPDHNFALSISNSLRMLPIPRLSRHTPLPPSPEHP